MNEVGAGAVVLAVDDDDDTRELYVVTLEQSGFTTLTASNLAEAREVLRRGVDVLIADHDLPDGSGADLMKLCAEHLTKVCILVTGHEASAVDTTGFHVTLRKPICFDRLVSTIRERLDLS